MPSSHDYKINFSPLAARHTEESLKEIQRFPLEYQIPKVAQSPVKSHLSHANITKFLQEEEVAVILHENGEYGVPGITFCCTDHMPFDQAGVPAFQFIQDGMEWGRHSHRTQDFADRLVLDDIRHNAVIIAWVAYQAAMREGGMPKK